MNQKQVIGILAPVDAGKTTLSEGLLYLSGKIRKLGRVDNKDAYLDTDALEKERGITIFSKQAVFTHKETTVMLMDTPGHVDFSAEMGFEAASGGGVVASVFGEQPTPIARLMASIHGVIDQMNDRLKRPTIWRSAVD